MKNVGDTVYDAKTGIRMRLIASYDVIVDPKPIEWAIHQEFQCFGCALARVKAKYHLD